MKEWCKPNVKVISFQNTESSVHDENCFMEVASFTSIGKNQHWCHNLNDGEGGWHDNGCGHPRNNQHQTNDDPEHPWDGEDHKSKC